MSIPWNFQQNGTLDIWLGPAVLPVGPPTVSGIPAQHMKPWTSFFGMKGTMIHRIIIPAVGGGIVYSTVIDGGEVAQFSDSAGNKFGYLVLQDFSPFPYAVAGVYFVDHIMVTYTTAPF